MVSDADSRSVAARSASRLEVCREAAESGQRVVPTSAREDAAAATAAAAGDELDDDADCMLLRMNGREEM
jgi:hypothetical protein